jgi:hypothetical protein
MARDALDQLVEVVRAQVCAGREPCVVQDEALDQVLVEPGRSPLPEARALRRANAISDRHDRGQRVVVYQPKN